MEQADIPGDYLFTCINEVFRVISNYSEIVASSFEDEPAIFDGNVYPCGKEFDEHRCNSKGNETTDVHAYPNGKSPFGCLDMCSNTRELTESEYADEHN